MEGDSLMDLFLMGLSLTHAVVVEPISDSKLSLHLIARYTPGAEQVVAAGPRVLKVLDLHGEMLRAARDYKTRWPDGQVVLRIYTQVSYPVGSDPAAAGRDYWERFLAPPLRQLPAEDRKLLDFVEGPNECEAYPAWETVENAAWFARFWQALAPLIHAAGFKACVGSIPVGNPPGTPEEIDARIRAFIPALRQVHGLGGAWSYHAYSLKYTTDLGEELWTSLRYRRFYDLFRQEAPDLLDLPLILTEAGIDLAGNAEKDGWQARGDAAKFQRWLAWFDEQLRQDPYVLGATLFQCGDPTGWRSFETEPINPWLAGHLRTVRAERPRE